MANAQGREEEEEHRKYEAERTKHEEEPEVGLTGVGDKAGLVKIEVITKEQGEQSYSGDFQEAAFIDELDVTVGAEKTGDGEEKDTTDEGGLAQQAYKASSAEVDVAKPDHSWFFLRVRLPGSTRDFCFA